MIDFAGLATAAAVGTGTRPLRAADLPEPIAAAIGVGAEPLVEPVESTPPVPAEPAPATADPAGLLLDAAAAWSSVRRARIAAGPDLPPLRLPAPTRPEAPGTVVSLLHRIRSTGAHREALQHEVLTALAVRGLTLPPELLLQLLGEVSRAEVARDVAALLDERGWALVGLDPVWSKALTKAGAASDVTDPRVWDEGSAAQRAQHLAAIRAADADAGRALLETPEFAREPAETRELLVRELAVGLSAADEAFLEARLDDRAKSVRGAAADLLSRLRGSAYVARAEAIAAAHMQRRQRMLRQPLTVVTPVPVTAATRRDQYREKDPDKTPAERLHLVDAIAIVPTDRWPTLVGATAAELATGLAEYHGNPIDLRPALARAALRWRDAELAEVLVAQDRTLLAGLLPVLRPPRRDQLLAEALGAGRGVALLDAVVHRPLAPALSVAAADALDQLARGRGNLHRLGELVGPLALNSDPLAAPALVERLRSLERRLPDEAGPAVRRNITAAAAVLQLRQAVAEALLPYPVLAQGSGRAPGRSGGETHQEGQK